MKNLNLKNLLIVSLLLTILGTIMKIMHLKFELLIQIFLGSGTILFFLLIILVVLRFTKNKAINF
jgi:hypothetical protein